MAEGTRRYAVVSGANKGIGLETVKQLASAGVTVVLTARDEKKGVEALERLRESGLSELVVFHKLDVADAASVTSLADFIKSQFGKLDILVNNAGISGIMIDQDALTALITKAKGQALSPNELRSTFSETYELAKECLETNYYGAKRTAEGLLPLLQLSDSPKIVNLSSIVGKLENISNEWAKGILSDAENLTEERVDQVLKEFLKDYKEGSIESKGWPNAYIVSKAAVSAYTRILAKKYPNMCINCVCPGFVKTDITANTGFLTVEEGATSVVKLALLPNGSPSGLFYLQSEVSSF